MQQYDYYKLFADQQLGFIVKGYGSYPQSSVLAGQVRVVFLDSFATEAQAREAFPDLATDGSEWGSRILDADLNRMPDTAPDWFDPADAGERWEDDY